MAADRPDPGTPSEWLDFARSDLDVARMAPAGRMLLDTLCFHAQQAAEKSVKAVLLRLGVPFPRTHSLDILLQMLPEGCRRPPDEDEIRDLSGYAMAGRYPAGLERVTPRQRDRAVAAASAALEWAEGLIEGPGAP
jgi:HEPN domain-containing protein